MCSDQCIEQLITLQKLEFFGCRVFIDYQFDDTNKI